MQVVVLSGRAGNGEELTFSINLLDSSGLQMHEQLNILHDAIPGELQQVTGLIVKKKEKELLNM